MHDHHHGHGHADGHGHAHGRAASRRSLTISLVLAAGYMLAEFVGGLWTGSLALLADAGHMLSDTASLALAVFALWIADRPADKRRTYGHARAEILAALVNGVTLVAVAVGFGAVLLTRGGKIRPYEFYYEFDEEYGSETDPGSPAEAEWERAPDPEPETREAETVDESEATAEPEMEPNIMLAITLQWASAPGNRCTPCCRSTLPAPPRARTPSPSTHRT